MVCDGDIFPFRPRSAFEHSGATTQMAAGDTKLDLGHDVAEIVRQRLEGKTILKDFFGSDP